MPAIDFPSFLTGCAFVCPEVLHLRHLQPGRNHILLGGDFIASSSRCLKPRIWQGKRGARIFGRNIRARSKTCQKLKIRFELNLLSSDKIQRLVDSVLRDDSFGELGISGELCLVSWGDVEEYVAELVLADKLSVRAAVPLACQKFLKTPTSELVLALASSAATFDTGTALDKQINADMALNFYRVLTAVSADLALYEKLGIKPLNCGGLLYLWRKEVDSFYDLPATKETRGTS